VIRKDPTEGAHAQMNRIQILFCRAMLCIALLILPIHVNAWNRVIPTDGTSAFPRHEAGALVYQGNMYLLGGRATNNLQQFDPAANSWTDLGPLPTEMHHFQPVEFNGGIYVIGSFRCCYPDEVTNPEIFRYDIASSQWSMVGTMPAGRLRGSMGAVVYNNKIYLIGGNTQGHNGGAVPWFDEYDPVSGAWIALADAPHARDHFMAAIIGDELVATSGRQSLRSAGNTVSATDIYDFGSGTWSTEAEIPTPRGGAMAVPFNSSIVVLGGESLVQDGAHTNAEVFDLPTRSWGTIQDMLTPRHSGGAAVIGDDLHVVSGNITRGGGNEVSDHEVINLSGLTSTATPVTEPVTEPVAAPDPTTDSDNDGLPDLIETTAHGTDPNNADTDDDGLTDLEEIDQFITNPLAADTDGDGLADREELDLGLDPLRSDTDGDTITDGDEIAIYSSNPLLADTDGDGLPDGVEVNDHETDPTDLDSDNDNIPDGFEIHNIGSDPTRADSDNDGLSDDFEFHFSRTNPTNPDSDDDGLTDTAELNIYNTDPTVADTDADGTLDGDEINLGTNPSNLDEDGDGLANSAEGLVDSDLDGLPNLMDRDSDNDGIPDVLESGLSDVNFDGMLDSVEDLEEFNRSVDTVDLVEKTEQVQEQTPPVQTVRDTRSVRLASVRNSDETSTPELITTPPDEDQDGVPNFLDLDSDQDGVSDYVESTARYESNITRNNSFDDANNDGLDDSYHQGIAPLDTDSDGIYNFLDLDSDNDGSYDLVESGSKDENNDGTLDSFIDADADGIADLGVPLLGEALPDEDNDNVPDLIDAVIQTGGRFGCTLDTTQRMNGFDPTLPFTLLLLLAYSRAGRSKVRPINTKL